MGGGSSKKPEPKKAYGNSNFREEQIPQYVRPPSPKVKEVKLRQLDIKEDENLDREAANKRLAEQQRKQKGSISRQGEGSPKKKELDISVSLRQEKANNKPVPFKIERIEESFDHGMGAFNAEDLRKLERILQDDDLSPINKSATESQKQKINTKKIVEAEQKIEKMNEKIKRIFDWPKSGQVHLISVGFKYNYNYKQQKLAMQKSYDQYVNSNLKWSFNEDNQVYEFKLTDLDVYDSQSGESKNLKFNEVEFMVTKNGVFIGLKHESDFVRILKVGKKQQALDEEKEQKEREELLSNQLNNLDRLTAKQLKNTKQIKTKKEDPEKIIKNTEKQLEQFWNLTFQCWYLVDEQKGTKLMSQNTPSLQLIQKDIENKSKLENFLLKKLQEPKFFKLCFDSNKTIRDTLKKWQMFTDEEELAYLNEPKYSLVQIHKRISFPMLEKHIISEGILSQNDFTPQSVTWDICKKTIMEHNQDLFVDIEHERKLLVLIWAKQIDSKSKLKTENYFVEELNKFRDKCDQTLKETLFQLSVIPNFPMANRPKYKQKYFQIQ